MKCIHCRMTSTENGHYNPKLDVMLESNVMPLVPDWEPHWSKIHQTAGNQ